MDIIQLISAAGLGGIVGGLLTTFVQAWLANNQLISNRKFEEKKEAYVGFLQAGHINEIQQTAESSTAWAYWQARCELVGSSAVTRLVHDIEETNPLNGQIHPDRPRVFAELKKEMRKDLAIDP